MTKHNNQIPGQRKFRKHWHENGTVKTWFNQPARKARRSLARTAKAAKSFPRPTAGLLRPVVHSQTVKYNRKKRLGRGFTLEELKEAGIPRQAARGIGISVDHRRRNRCLESLQENSTRLKAYRASLVVFPRRSKKPKQGDASKEEIVNASQKHGVLLPIEAPGMKQLETVTLTDEMKGFGAYRQLRQERTNKRLHGKREKRAAEAAAEEKDKAK